MPDHSSPNEPSEAEIAEINAAGAASGTADVEFSSRDGREPKKSKKGEPLNPDLLPPPIPQIARNGIILGFDPESSIATFATEVNGKREEITCVVPKSDPLYNQHYKLLLGAIDRDGRVPALRLRLAMPLDPTLLPTLVFATPTATDRENKFSWNGTKLTWTDDLDQAVDIDFDRAADEFAAKYLRDMLQASDAKHAFTGAKMLASEIFMEEGKEFGTEVTSLAEEYSKSSLSDVLAGKEYVGGVTRQVRYDTRYSFRQQAQHVIALGDNKSIASALANYSAQKALMIDAADRAKTRCDLPGGATGSLAELHQQELLEERMLLAANPSLAEFKNVFAQYSFESVRNALAGNLAGMMEVAGVPPARAEFDLVEHAKKDRESKYSRVLESLSPEDKENPDPAYRAGAFLGASLTLEESFRKISKAEVGNSQSVAAPSQRDMLKPVQRENGLANLAREGLKGLERVIDLM
jgi:hypothetical protein